MQRGIDARTEEKGLELTPLHNRRRFTTNRVGLCITTIEFEIRGFTREVLGR